MPETIRASSLPLLSECPAAAQVGDVVLDTADESAALGTACHAVQALVIGGLDVGMGLQLALDLVPVQAKVYGVNEEELDRLVWLWWRTWEVISPHFPEPQSEVYFEAGGLTGHIDILSVSETHLRIADLKTGYKDSDYLPQLQGYAWLALQAYPTLSEVYACILWARDQSTEGWTFTRAELDGWWSSLQERIAKGGYNPGAHCGYCPRSLHCPAKTALVRETAEAFALTQEINEWRTVVEGADPEALIALLDNTKMLEEACERARQVVRFAVAEAGGVLTAADGRQLVLTETERREIDPVRGWYALTHALPGTDVLHCISVSKTDVEKAARETAPRGQKKAAVDSLMQALADAGAISTTTTSRLTVRRAPSEALSHTEEGS